MTRAKATFIIAKKKLTLTLLALKAFVEAYQLLHDRFRAVQQELQVTPT